MYKGKFWYDPTAAKLIVKKVACDRNGIALETVEYSSKSGDNFNHKVEWEKFPRSITSGYPYNYYPRGRVEIKKNKAKIYLNPILICFDYLSPEPWCPLRLVEKEFGLGLETIRAQVITDNSKHYQYLTDYYLINHPEHK